MSATNPDSPAEPPTGPSLTAPQRRVVGALIEKQYATPADYPLSPNALMRATNQSTSRDPVVDYDQSSVERVASELKALGLVRFVHQSGRVTTRFRHCLDEALDLDRSALAVVAVLLLRGPQTAGELRSRTERIHHFADVGEVSAVLDALASRPSPVVAPAPRGPGQKELRWMDLLGEVETMGAPPAETAGVGEPDRAVSPPPADGGAPADRVGTDAPHAPPAGQWARATDLDALRSEVEQLRAVVASLREDLGLE